MFKIIICLSLAILTLFTSVCAVSSACILNKENLVLYNPEYIKFLSIFCRPDTVISEEWKQIDLNGDNKPDFCTNLKTGFEATAFKSKNEIVIAIRGLKIPVNELKNDRSIKIFSGTEGKSTKALFVGNLGIMFFKQVPEQFYDAEKFYNLIRSKYPGFRIILVGKSLGGALAQILGAVEGVETYTFAAPGAKYALSVLPSKYRKSLRINSKSNFLYIKNYYNLNDPCGNYGEHIGISYVYPPVSIKNNMFYDIHGNIDHFGHKENMEKIISKPKEWESKYTAALIYYDKIFFEKSKCSVFGLILKYTYHLTDKTLFEAKSVVNRNFTYQINMTNFRTGKESISSISKSDIIPQKVTSNGIPLL
ncbi:MAG: hypothetical protein WC197_08585 [Candidatus Gastranaerophilaceae bacterium]|jgi:hypothetical protein